jgi:hypothetical protein
MDFRFYFPGIIPATREPGYIGDDVIIPTAILVLLMAIGLTIIVCIMIRKRDAFSTGKGKRLT